MADPSAAVRESLFAAREWCVRCAAMVAPDRGQCPYCAYPVGSPVLAARAALEGGSQ